MTCSVVERRQSNAFPNIENIIEYEKDLVNDNYSDIPLWKFERCSFIIFNDTGKALYSSKKDINDKVSYSDLDKISEYNDSLYTEAASIIEDDNSIIEKYSYKNNSGKDRTLVMISPRVTYEEYNQVVKQTNKVWAVSIPVSIIIVLVTPFVFTRKIKKSIEIINKSISSYTHYGFDAYNIDDVPFEFETIVDNNKALISELNKSQEEKDFLYKENQRIITDLSHDLKTPLTIIQGYSKAYIDGKIPQGEEKHYLQTIFNKAQLSNELVDTLFDYIRMEHPSFELKLERTDACEFVRDFLAQKYCEIENHDFTLDLDIPNEQIFVWLDKKQFGRVLENLINNSLKYNEKDTTLYVALQKKNDNIVLTIADNGIGIDESIRNDIFKPFITSNDSRLAGRGTGLGLSIVKKIIELHNGTIVLLPSKSSKYSTEFKIHLKG